MVIRSFLRQFFTAKTPAERLATLFWVSPAEADAALDAVGGDVSRAESLLLYAVGNNLCAATAIAEMFPAPGLDGLSIWERPSAAGRRSSPGGRRRCCRDRCGCAQRSRAREHSVAR